MTNQIKLLVYSENVADLVIELIEVDGIEVQFAEDQAEMHGSFSPKTGEIHVGTYPAKKHGELLDENKEHPFYSLDSHDLTTVLIALPAIITSLAGFAKVILDYKVQKKQIESEAKKNSEAKTALKEPSIVIGDRVIPLSRFSTAEELSKFLEKEIKKTSILRLLVSPTKWFSRKSRNL